MEWVDGFEQNKVGKCLGVCHKCNVLNGGAHGHRLWRVNKKGGGGGENGGGEEVKMPLKMPLVGL